MLAASQIYNMLMAYEGNVTVKIDSIAASAASVIAMAGKKVLISPTGLILIHDPASVAIGNTDEMRKAIQMLDEVKNRSSMPMKCEPGFRTPSSRISCPARPG